MRTNHRQSALQEENFMSKKRNILQVLDELIDTLTEISILFSKNLKESIRDDLLVLVNKSRELIEWADKHFEDLKEENIKDVNNRFDDLMNTISVLMARYNASTKTEETEKVYKDLVINLEVLGRRNNELENKYHLGLHQLKPSLTEGVTLIKAGLKKIFEDIDWEFVEGRKSTSKSL